MASSYINTLYESIDSFNQKRTATVAPFLIKPYTVYSHHYLPERSAVTDIFGYKVDLLAELGRGGFGTVYKGTNRFGKTIAVKKISKKERTKASAEAVKFHYLKRIISHRQIVDVYDVKSRDDSMWIMMEYCDLGELNEYFKRNNWVRNYINQKVILMQQIINGIAFLHSNRIVHRDNKPGNVLLKSKPLGHPLVKLGDFGLSKILDPDSVTSAMSSNVGTLSFKAPEFWDKKPGNKLRYHRNVDVYSAGLTFTAMLQAQADQNLVPSVEGSLHASETNMPIGLAAYSRMTYKQSAISVVKIRSSDDRTTKDLKQLIRKMTYAQPESRITSLQVKRELNNMIKVSRKKTTNSKWSLQYYFKKM